MYEAPLTRLQLTAGYPGSLEFTNSPESLDICIRGMKLDFWMLTGPDWM